MHALIAASITHLSEVVPSYHPSVPAEYHWSRAISLVNEGLDGPVDSTNVDAILSTCLMLTIHAFVMNDPSDLGPWSLSETGINWLYIGGSLATVFEKFGASEHQTIWTPVFKHCDDYMLSAVFEIQDFPPAFRDLCEINESSNESNNPYYLPLRTLLILMRLELSSANFSRFVLFVGQTRAEYGDLLRQKDPRALLILAYWFGLLCALDQWWMQDRVRLECKAICLHLESHCQDRRILELLEFPGLACGHYTGAHMAV